MISFSVLIPNVDFHEYLIPCIESLINQNKKNCSFEYEIIICDQSDLNIHNEIRNEINKKYGSIVKLIYQKEKSRYKARMRLLQESSFDYIVFVDSDDYVSGDYLFNIYKELINANYPDVLIHNFCCVESDGTICKKQLEVPCDIQAHLLDYYYYSNYLNSIVRKIFKRKLFDPSSVPQLEVKSGEDWIISYPIMKNAKAILFKDEFYGYFYRQNTSSISHLINYETAISSLYFKDRVVDWKMNEYQKQLYLMQKLYDLNNCFSYLIKNKIINCKTFSCEVKKFRKNICNDLHISKYSRNLAFKQKTLLFLLKVRLFFVIFILLKF